MTMRSISEPTMIRPIMYQKLSFVWQRSPSQPSLHRQLALSWWFTSHLPFAPEQSCLPQMNWYLSNKKRFQLSKVINRSRITTIVITY